MSANASKTWRFPHCPAPPDWHLDWDAITARFAWIRQMAGVPQDTTYHAEGDVLVHTRMVVAALAALEEWRQLPECERSILFAAALLHDVAKPLCTRTEEDGRITSHGHARRGERLARQILWEAWDLGHLTPLRVREAIAKLVRHHGLPLWFLEKPSPPRAVHEASQTVRGDRMALLAEADVRGRVCADQEDLLLRIALFREFCAEEQCLDRPRPFATPHSRFCYFRNEGRDPEYEAYDDARLEVILMSGLPGAGKDHWIRANVPGWPVLSLDALRQELGVGPDEQQGRVIEAAKARARGFLRQGTSFVWNATNVTRAIRGPLIDMLATYRARIRLIYVEAPRDLLLQRNRDRPDSVPERVIHSLMSRLDIPDQTEAHAVEWSESGGQ